MSATTHPAISLAWLAASILFILSLRGLSSQRTARQGNLWGVVGMALAVVATSGYADRQVWRRRRLRQRARPARRRDRDRLRGRRAARVARGDDGDAGAGGRAPQLRRAGRGAGGLRELSARPMATLEGAGHGVHLGEIYIGVLVGAVTFTGSIVAFLKLRGTIGSRPLLLPARHALNAVVVLAMLVLGVMFVSAEGTDGLVPLGIMAVLAGGARRAPGDGHRRRRHAGRRVAAELLLGVGGVGGRLHAVERPARSSPARSSDRPAPSSPSSCATR